MVSPAHFSEYQIRNSGVDSVIVCWPECPVSPYLIQTLAAQLQSKLSWIQEVLVAELSLQIRYNPLLMLYADVKRHIKQSIDELEFADAPSDLQTKIRIPVCYHPSLAPDIERIQTQCSVDLEQLIQLHSRAEYMVSMIGFAPGFGYLRGLPKQLQVPRLKSPRVSVPRGSVAIAEHYSAIYPQTSPGGWSLIGKTPVTLFDVYRTPPCLLSVGARVKFDAIELDEFSEMARELSES